MSIFSSDNTRRNRLKNPSTGNNTRPIHGMVLLKYFKDKPSLASLCDLLRVEYKTDHTGYPLKSTFDGIIEALIHNIISRDIGIHTLLCRLQAEMKHSKFPLTTNDEWITFKLFEGDETYL